MNDYDMDLNSAELAFSGDSRVMESLLKGLLSRQASRVAVSFEELDGGSKPRMGFSREPGAPAKDKGRGL